MRRRAFLIGSALAALTSCFRRKSDETQPPPAPVKPAQQQALPDRYRAVMRSLVARLYPDLAVTAKAADYIEQELLRSNMQGVKHLIMNGCVQLDRVALGRLKNGFVNLTPGDQDAVISAVQIGEGAPKGFDGEKFIAAAVAMTLEGVFCDPVYGGNADESGWKSIGWVMQTPRPAKS